MRWVQREWKEREREPLVREKRERESDSGQ
jgi:hypothetical protein